jgi:hypothetical protein
MARPNAPSGWNHVDRILFDGTNFWMANYNTNTISRITRAVGIDCELTRAGGIAFIGVFCRIFSALAKPGSSSNEANCRRILLRAERGEAGPDPDAANAF